MPCAPQSLSSLRSDKEQYWLESVVVAACELIVGVKDGQV